MHRGSGHAAGRLAFGASIVGRCEAVARRSGAGVWQGVCVAPGAAICAVVEREMPFENKDLARSDREIQFVASRITIILHVKIFCIFSMARCYPDYIELSLARICTLELTRRVNG